MPINHLFSSPSFSLLQYISKRRWKLNETKRKTPYYSRLCFHVINVFCSSKYLKSMKMEERVLRKSHKRISQTWKCLVAWESELKWSTKCDLMTSNHVTMLIGCYGYHYLYDMSKYFFKTFEKQRLSSNEMTFSTVLLFLVPTDAPPLFSLLFTRFLPPTHPEDVFDSRYVNFWENGIFRFSSFSPIAFLSPVDK